MSNFKIKWMDTYNETVDEFGVTHIWHNATIKESIVTHRGTKVEMVERPKWGLTCYMDNSIQSCLSDERIYHEALVHPIMSFNIKNVCIVGGGEGATAREVLKWPVEKVDMYEWDKDVVELFKKYPEWSQGAWDDPRLNVIQEDIFEVSVHKKYDALIIDLFEPSEKWEELIKKLSQWSNNIVMYAGMNSADPPYKKLMNMIQKLYDQWRGIPVNDIIVKKTYVPSFLGEAVFLVVK